MSTPMKERLIQTVIVCFRYLLLFLVVATTLTAMTIIPDMLALMARLAESHPPLSSL